MIEDILTEKLGLKEEEKEETRQIIKQALEEGKIKFIKDYGFFTWRDVYKEGKRYIYIENMYIEPDKRKYNNLLFIRKFMRDKYPSGFVFAYWHNGKKDKFCYIKGD